ncbi:MAG: tyrosine--tRNA ligase [Candidatus Pacebacteria bacterium]|nr:tyrosine--tRNA ligase [Candidatus Paceibacterota bacterium]
MKTETDPQKIKNALARGVEKIYPDFASLEKKLASGKRLRLYCGYDPSGASLHIGHLITLKKLAGFQSLGHEIIMLIGDFTGMIGDPTEKATTRKKLTRQEVLRNSKNYKKLAGKIISFSPPNPAKILYNSKWSDKLTFVDLIELASNFTVQQMITRDMFQERIKEGRPIFLHEFLYPLAQAYDSVAMDVDLEVGGKDQTFNMLCGRDLMKVLKNKEKFVLALKLLTDPSGKKMGKSEGNAINIDDKPKEMFGKIMNWPDELIVPGLELCTNVPLDEISSISEEIKNKRMNPRDAKAMLAKEIVAICYDKKTADGAEEEFNKVFKEKEAPSDIPEIKIEEKALSILDLLVRTNLVRSKSEAKRLVLQGGVKIENKTEKNWEKEIPIKEGMVIQIGKRRFVKVN